MELKTTINYLKPKPMKKLLFALIGLIIPLTFFAQNKTFSDFDKDGDGFIERYEFVDVFTANYVDDWDNTDDAGLDDEDFYTTSYARLNVNDNDYIDPEEWVTGYNYFYGDYLYDDYVLYDTDGDGYVEYAEYYDALYDSDYFMSWDVDNDGYLDQYELAYAVFDNWDVNDNLLLNRSEYNSFDYYYLDI